MIVCVYISVFVPVPEEREQEVVVLAVVDDHLFVIVCILVTDLVSVCYPGSVCVLVLV